MTRKIEVQALLLAIGLVWMLPASLQAAIYLVGNEPFGGWNPASGVEMTETSSGVYSYEVSIDGTVWFVFADGLSSDWSTFNNNYRYGPSADQSQEVAVGVSYATSKSSTNHAYKFTGDGEDYIFTFNLNELTFRIDVADEPVIIDYPVGDVNGDGLVTLADINMVIEILLGSSVDYDTRQRADVNSDSEVSVADINAIIAIIMGDQLPIVEKTGYDYVWDDDEIPEIHLEITLSEWNRLLALYDANKYTTQYVMGKASFIKGGETTIIDSIGVRLKGNTSRRRPEGSAGEWHQADNTDWHHVHFGVNLRKYVDDDAHTIQGVRKLHLKWFKDDAAYVRELFCYELFRRAGIWTAVRDNYCRLWLHIEGDSQETYYGVYEMIEPIDKRYLKARKEQLGASNGFLWKCRNAAAGLNNPDGDIWYDDDSDDRHAYTLKTQTAEFESAKSQLQTFMNNLTNLSDSEFYAWIQTVTDVDLLLHTYAVNVSVGMWDDYWNNANNYYLYFNSQHPTNYQFYFIPYDYDNTLGTSLDCGSQSDAGRQDPLNWGSSGRPLIARLLKFDDFKATYVAYLKQLVTEGNALMDRSASQTRIRSWQAKISQYIDNDTGEDTSISDVPASWGNHSEYRLLKNCSDNFFTVKAAVINALE